MRYPLASMEPTHRSVLVAIGLLCALLVLELSTLRGASPPTAAVASRPFHPTRLADASVAAQAPGCPPRIRNDWALKLTPEHQTQVTSQYGQDGILSYIFHHIGTTNKFFVEFGFDTNTYESSTGNTALLYKRFGWHGLLMDGGHANPAINLHTEFISADNILDLFKKHNVPAEPDYVSIDIDSADLWVFKKIITSGIYRPRVITTEYNSNLPFNSTVTWPPTYNGSWHGQNKFYGSGLGAFHAVAQEAGYSIVWVMPPVDIFYVRSDLLEGVTDVPPLTHWEHCGRVPIHNPASAEDVARFTEYHTYQRTGSEEQAAAAAQEQMREMGVDLTRAP